MLSIYRFAPRTPIAKFWGSVASLSATDPGAVAINGLGHIQLVDGCIHDGLQDPYDDQHMGMCAEKCANGYSFSREDQDGYTLESYRRAQASVDSGCFEEIVPVEVPQRSGAPVVVDKDEEPHAVNVDKVAGLRPAFDKKMAL